MQYSDPESESESNSDLKPSPRQESESAVAVVVGGGGGIGTETCRVLANRGSIVVVADLNLAAAEATASSISDLGYEAHAQQCDISDEASVGALFEWMTSTYGRVDQLVNVAADLSAAALGRDSESDVSTIPLDAWDRTLEVGLRGFVLTIRQAAPLMAAAKRGSIVNVSSLAAFRGDPIRPAYGVTKAGVNALTRHVASAFGKDGVRCNAVAPGLVLTPTALATFTTEQIETRAKNNPSGRLGTPTDVANAISFLASDDSSWINGQILVVDGGDFMR